MRIPISVFDNLLSVLTVDRRLHSRAVGSKVAAVAHLIPPPLRADVIMAAVLHDIGYGHATTGFHSIDGARYLGRAGFSLIVCHLVAHHSASTDEAIQRRLDPDIFDEFRVGQDLGPAHAVLWWADLTTGPLGQTMSVEERLEEICGRYGVGDPVTAFVQRARHKLIAAGQSPIGSIQVSS